LEKNSKGICLGAGEMEEVWIDTGYWMRDAGYWMRIMIAHRI
jgi:hypothetical protein